MQRPEFVRKTKHSGTGHENMDYSYVVIRRGPRPAQTSAKVGRVGDIGLRELAKRAADSVPMNRLSLASDLHDETELSHKEESSRILDSSQASSESHELASAEVISALRQEAYSWPRLIFPPIKRSGHVILDVCHPQGTSPAINPIYSVSNI